VSFWAFEPPCSFCEIGTANSFSDFYGLCACPFSFFHSSHPNQCMRWVYSLHTDKACIAGTCAAADPQCSKRQYNCRPAFAKILA